MWMRTYEVMDWRSGGVLAGASKTASPVARAAWVFALLFFVALGGGCKKSAPGPALMLPTPVDTIARIHWLGMKRLAADTNAANFMTLLDLPESQTLATQTLDKLAVGLVAGNQLSVISNQLSVISNQLSAAASQLSATNHQSLLTGSAALLRPLLDDLLQQESYVEVRQATNQPGELGFAIRLSEERARLWQTNLASVLESLAGSRAVAGSGRTNGWQLQFISPQSPNTDHRLPITDHQSPITRFLELARAGEWTVIGVGHETNALVGEFIALIERDGKPFAKQSKDFWLYADFDLRRVASALSLDWQLSAGLPRLSVSAIGDNQGVHTWCQLNFPQPLPFKLEPWNIPTNLIYEPLVSFTAIQGIQPWLSSWRPWQDLHIGAPPNQLYIWARRGLPLSFCAAPLPDGSNQVYQLAGQLLQVANPWLATNGLGQFNRGTNDNGAAWDDLTVLSPYLRSVSTSQGEFAFGGLEVEEDSRTNRPPPAALYLQVTGQTNLVGYDWELTGPRITQWLYFGQFLRFALHKAQVPPKSASFAWLTALETRLGNCGTAVTLTGPAQLTLRRGSSLGLTAAELDWLADWLESPQFPRGLNTFLGEPTRIPAKRGPRPGSGSTTNTTLRQPSAKP